MIAVRLETQEKLVSGLSRTLIPQRCYLYMKKAELIPVLIVSSLLLFYVVLAFLDKASGFTSFIFSFSPLLVIWLVYAVIRHGQYKGKELKSDEEFGYTDKL